MNSREGRKGSGSKTGIHMRERKGNTWGKRRERDEREWEGWKEGSKEREEVG